MQLLQLLHAAEIAGAAGDLDGGGADRAGPRPGCSTPTSWSRCARRGRPATRARNAIFLVRGRASDQLPRPGAELAGVARACGYGPDLDAGQFLDDYRRITRRARGVVDQVFYGQPPTA